MDILRGVPGRVSGGPSLPPGSVRPGSSLALVETPALSSASASTSPSHLTRPRQRPRGPDHARSRATLLAIHGRPSVRCSAMPREAIMGGLPDLRVDVGNFWPRGGPHGSKVNRSRARWPRGAATESPPKPHFRRHRCPLWNRQQGPWRAVTCQGQSIMGLGPGSGATSPEFCIGAPGAPRAWQRRPGFREAARLHAGRRGPRRERRSCARRPG